MSACHAMVRPGIAIALLMGFLTGKADPLPSEVLDTLPPPASRTVDFVRDIQPILESSCIRCHGHGKSRGGFRLDTRETTLEDGNSGPALVVGDSRNSYLIHLVAGLEPDNLMPEKGRRLRPDEVGLLRAWIDQGLNWDPQVTFRREPHRHLQPRQPELPEGPVGMQHPIDRFLHDYLSKHEIPSPSPVDDDTFLRRLHLDVVGLLPTPEERAEFGAAPASERRANWVRRLLEEDDRYAQHWISFWNDLLRNDYRGTGYIDGGREQITQWLYAALRDNQPYRAFVRDLVNPGEGGPRGFTKGIVWRGVVNASQVPEMQAAQNISQVFLGVNLKCASCHDSFIDDWQLADAYGMAGVYSEKPMELVECDRPLGRSAPLKFLFPELGTLPSDAPRAERIAALADLVTSPANGRLPRTIINRLWARFFGYGLVEPLDVMQNPAWHADLLDWLAEDLVAHGDDLRHTMEVMLTSQAYQWPAVDVPDGGPRPAVFRGPAVRRLTAEQFRDALGQMTGVWHARPEGGLDKLLVEARRTEDPLPAAPYWVWSDPHAAVGAPPQTVYFRRTFELPAVPAEALAYLHADNHARVWVNGQVALDRHTREWNELNTLNLRPFLHPGNNTLAVEAVNGGDGLNPAGLLLYARLRSPSMADLDFATDGAWKVSTESAPGWTEIAFADAGWASAQVLGVAGMAPWNLGDAFASQVAGGTPQATVRAALVSADPLTTALGRPNREQVTSDRPITATTLQMLELTNGETLAGILLRGADLLVEKYPDPEQLVATVFQRGLGRLPTAVERQLSLELMGSTPERAGVSDLLWSVSMLPEFQLIH
jgi:hypothetical protein